MRFNIIFSIFIFIWVALIFRLYTLTINNNEYYESLAEQNFIKKVYVAPIRGVILDRNNEPLATNKVGIEIAIKPNLRTNKKLLEEQIDKIVSYLPTLDKESMMKEYLSKDSFYNHEDIVVVNFVDYKDMHSIYTYLLQEPYISLLPTTARLYNGEYISHVTGYVSRATQDDVNKRPDIKYIGYIGKTGLEKKYNKFLEGEMGYKNIKVNALNKKLGVVINKKPVEYQNIKLSIDLRIQKKIAELFQEIEGNSGVALVMDATNGELISFNSFPTYDSNKFVFGISTKDWKTLITDETHPFTNKAINGLYAPGSTIKMGIGLSILEYTDIDEHTVIDTPPFIEVGGRKFRDWLKKGHGKSDFVKAIKRSVDVYFYKMGLKTGIDNIDTMLFKLGFGAKTGIDLPYEFLGRVPTPEWKKKRFNEGWFNGDTANTSIGQGDLLVTPLQVARYTGILATGKAVTPHLVIQKTDKKIFYKTKDVLNDFEKSKLSAVRLGMYKACNEIHGTGTWYVRKTKVRIGCKTGTAQVIGIDQGEEDRTDEKDLDYKSRSHAWMTAFLPAENPKYVITLLVEHGSHGGGTTGPIMTEIVNKMAELNYFQTNELKSYNKKKKNHKSKKSEAT